MKIIQRAIITSLFLAGVNARLGRKRVGGRGYEAITEEIDVVVVFEDDDADAFTEMSDTFTGLAEDVEVHSMLKRLKMATLRAKPTVSIPLLLHTSLMCFCGLIV